MRSAWIWWLVAAIVVAGGVYYAFVMRSEPAAQPSEQTTTINSPGGTDYTPPATTGAAPAAPTPSEKSYTVAEVATHAGKASCWSVIDGNVYDLTSWILKHPGGEEAILSICGKDGTAAFHGQHGDAPRQAQILATMKIGVLAK